MNFICREQVLAILYSDQTIPILIKEAIEKIPSFPAPNPEMRDGRNIMGQTEDEFWDLVDKQK